MNILLTMNLPYTRVYGGANRSNRALAENLATQGHSVQVVVPALAVPSTITVEQYIEELLASGFAVREGGNAYIVQINNVTVHIVPTPSRLRLHLLETIRHCNPDWVLVSSEDATQNLLHASLSVAPEQTIYLAHTPQMFPFGPSALYPSQRRSELIARCRSVVAISKFVRVYFAEHAKMDCFVNHPPHYGTFFSDPLARYDGGYVLLINVSEVKGLSILLQLAGRLPAVQFAVLPGYATTSTDIKRLQSLHNVTILKNRTNLDDILGTTRVLLMPSLWCEGFGMAVVDAMLRGIPVLSSNLGGLPEAKLGTDYILPVCPIEQYEDTIGENMLPIPIVPEQDFRPWLDALQELLSSASWYERQSRDSYDRATSFVASLSIVPFEAHLERSTFSTHSILGH